MKILKVVKDYRNKDREYEQGSKITVEDDEAAFLMRDAPGCFAEYKPKAKAADEPPKDKAVKASPRKKAVKAKK